MLKLMNPHPCLSCGACCARFRVSFHWSETLPDSLGVPLDTWEPISPHLNAMKGTNTTPARCESLKGELGNSVHCEIYSNRPSPCRNFVASYENGERNLRCDEARLTLGLPPLPPLWNTPLEVG